MSEKSLLTRLTEMSREACEASRALDTACARLAVLRREQLRLLQAVDEANNEHIYSNAYLRVRGMTERLPGLFVETVPIDLQ
ncbi:hypothetical protein [Piscinibacter sp.]|uniref:hypothetical protein n=1 Tax=Piscinibacter sp. TaxID=1903157 RepID=UPI002C7BCC7D|nr:hypothetical protein [Albitalea sp.]HUG26312.1 hypothetical protein [Albitalea sp.]